MEENIKILEEFTESSCCLAWQEEIIECVKNLIKGYRELEEKYNKLFDKYNDRVEEIVNLEKERDGIYVDYQDLGKAYYESIPKSKIKENIEIIEKWLDNGKYARYGMNPYELEAQKEILIELLEDK